MAALYNNGWEVRSFAMNPANVVEAVPTKAVDVTQATKLSFQFEVQNGYAAATTIEFWAYPDLAGTNGCSPDLANGVQIAEIDLCDITGKSLVVDAVNIPANTPIGSRIWARPRCFPYRWVGVKGVAGDFAKVSPTAAFSGVK
jgi:hypothetical protein